MAKGGFVSKVGSTKLAKVADAGNTVRQTAHKAAERAKAVPPPSPNAMTNLLIADVAVRGGGRLLRHVVERNLLKAKYPPETAKSLINGRGMVQTLVVTAIARIATRSVPGAIVVGGGLIAKALYDRRKGAEAEVQGNKAVARRAAKGA